MLSSLTSPVFSGPVIAIVIINAARRVNHRSLGRREKPDEEARRPRFFDVTVCEPGSRPLAEQGQKAILRIADVFTLFRVRDRSPLIDAIPRQGDSRYRDPPGQAARCMNGPSSCLERRVSKQASGD